MGSVADNGRDCVLILRKNDENSLECGSELKTGQARQAQTLLPGLLSLIERIMEIIAG